MRMENVCTKVAKKIYLGPPLVPQHFGLVHLYVSPVCLVVLLQEGTSQARYHHDSSGTILLILAVTIYFLDCITEKSVFSKGAHTLNF